MAHVALLSPRAGEATLCSDQGGLSRPSVEAQIFCRLPSGWPDGHLPDRCMEQLAGGTFVLWQGAAMC